MQWYPDQASTHRDAMPNQGQSLLSKYFIKQTDAAFLEQHHPIPPLPTPDEVAPEVLIGQPRAASGRRQPEGAAHPGGGNGGRTPPGGGGGGGGGGPGITPGMVDDEMLKILRYLMCKQIENN